MRGRALVLVVGRSGRRRQVIGQEILEVGCHRHSCFMLTFVGVVAVETEGLACFACR